ncbi:unnamed protein product [Moneuplotes crassus]|uniref:Uncharacterized protein n=1 Tax=Euplotes crassus TaxID=5936 RepID=A0AAD1UB81_EUPCR|nr:unnamed protein product [Moneuplotes crassus]
MNNLSQRVKTSQESPNNTEGLLFRKVHRYFKEERSPNIIFHNPVLKSQKNLFSKDSKEDNFSVTFDKAFAEKSFKLDKILFDPNFGDIMSVTQTNRTYTSQAREDSNATMSARKKQSYKNLRRFMERKKKPKIYKPPTVLQASENEGLSTTRLTHSRGTTVSKASQRATSIRLMNSPLEKSPQHPPKPSNPTHRPKRDLSHLVLRRLTKILT